MILGTTVCVCVCVSVCVCMCVSVYVCTCVYDINICNELHIQCVCESKMFT